MANRVNPAARSAQKQILGANSGVDLSGADVDSSMAATLGGEQSRIERNKTIYAPGQTGANANHPATSLMDRLKNLFHPMQKRAPVVKPPVNDAPHLSEAAQKYYGH
jgi:hypothetical protein